MQRSIKHAFFGLVVCALSVMSCGAMGKQKAKDVKTVQADAPSFQSQLKPGEVLDTAALAVSIDDNGNCLFRRLNPDDGEYVAAQLFAQQANNKKMQTEQLQPGQRPADKVLAEEAFYMVLEGAKGFLVLLLLCGKIILIKGSKVFVWAFEKASTKFESYIQLRKEKRAAQLQVATG